MRAVLVGRVSTEHASQETSLERQRAELEDLAHRRGWTVVGWFEDRSSGSKVASREGLGRALEELARGRADILVVHDLDRLGRDVRGMLETVDALSKIGKGLYVRDQEIDATGPFGRLVFTILCAVGEFYRRDGRRKVREGLARRRRRGLALGRTRELDWTKLPRAWVLRNEGRSWKELAAELGGTRSGWSNAFSKIERLGYCHAVGELEGKPVACILYSGHGGERHLSCAADDSTRWWVSPNPPPSPVANPAIHAASPPSPGKVP